VIGVATLTRHARAHDEASTFDFGNVRIPPGITIAFTQAVVAGDPSITYDRGEGDCNVVFQTIDTQPTLSEAIRAAVGIVITGRRRSTRPPRRVVPARSAQAGESVLHGFFVT
jgi:hypothetical protein